MFLSRLSNPLFKGISSKICMMNRIPCANFVKCATCEASSIRVPKGMDEYTKKLAEGVLQQDRWSISKATSLLENTRNDKIQQADLLLDYVMGVKREQREKELGPGFHPGSFRIGIAGPPGAGKSTFINRFGTLLAQKDHKVAVIAIDPSSTKSKGSILGDKTRMKELLQQPNVYVRAAASGGTLGGVAENTVDMVHLVEAAGYDIVIVETVGLGQLEVMVDDMVDMFMLLMPPLMGDELQGVKKGVMEHADIIVISKADGPLLRAANKTAGENRRALEMQRKKSPTWKCKVQTCSSNKNTNIEKVWKICSEFYDNAIKTNELEKKRKEQGERAMWTQVDKLIVNRAVTDPELSELAIKYKAQMLSGGLTRRRAAMKLLDCFLSKPHELIETK